MQEEELLKQQTQFNRLQFESRLADTNTNESVATKYLGYDPDQRLAKLQDTNGNVFYAKANTNGSVARGQDVRLRRGYGLPGYDAMPCYKAPIQQPITKKPIPPTYYFAAYTASYGYFLDTFGVSFTKQIQGSDEKIIVDNTISFQNNGSYKSFTYFSFQPFIPLLTLTTFVTLGFIELKENQAIQNVKLKLKISTSYSLTNLDIAYFVNKSNATIVESVPSPLYLYLGKNSTNIFSVYGDGSYGSRELEIELTANDFSPLELGEQQTTLILGGYIRAQDSIFYGGVGHGAIASISHHLEIKIESVNSKIMNLKRKLLQEQ
ncbi:MAG: hypothetical protein V7K47_07090 [Nostoc sp.]